MLTIIIFIAILSILVVAHEFGHFFTARRAGMKVYEFGLGFPPRGIGIYKDPVTKKWVVVRGKGRSSLKETVGGDGTQEEFPTTLYSLNWLPLGGFVKIKGENGEAPTDRDSFGNHKAWKRFVVVVAGVIMNVILAGILLAIGFGIGLPTDITDGAPAGAVVGDKMVVVGQVSVNSPAEAAGIKFGDELISINELTVKNSRSFLEYVRANPEKEMKITVLREGENLAFTATPAVLDSGEDNIARLGLLLSDAAIVRFPWYMAFYKGFVAAFFGFITILSLFIILLKNLILGQGLAYDISGPIGIASIIGQSARMGINYLIGTTATLSLTLAVINILPIPALDGGRAWFIILEKIIRKPIPIKYEQLAHTVGFVLLMVLVVVVTVKDIFRLAGA